MRWALLVTAPNQLAAEMWRTLLENNGIPAIVRPEDAPSFFGVSAHPCRLLVLEDRIEEARAVLDSGKEAEDAEES